MWPGVAELTLICAYSGRLRKALAYWTVSIVTAAFDEA
jgi:hypothetical protein